MVQYHFQTYMGLVACSCNVHKQRNLSILLLRIGVVMFLDVPEEGRRKPLPYGHRLERFWICLVATILLGLSGDTLIDICYRAADSLNLA